MKLLLYANGVLGCGIPNYTEMHSRVVQMIFAKASAKLKNYGAVVRIHPCIQKLINTSPLFSKQIRLNGTYNMVCTGHPQSGMPVMPEPLCVKRRKEERQI
jgi:hypothetical protein